MPINVMRTNALDFMHGTDHIVNCGQMSRHGDRDHVDGGWGMVAEEDSNTDQDLKRTVVPGIHRETCNANGFILCPI